MKKGMIGKKIGMTQVFDEKGNVIPVTVIEVGPCVVAQKKTVEKDGYNALQLGFMDVKKKHLTKADQGHFEKAGVPMKKHLKEFRLDDCSAEVGHHRRYLRRRREGRCNRYDQGSRIQRRCQALESPHAVLHARCRPDSPSGRFYGCKLHPVPRVQKQEDGRTVR